MLHYAVYEVKASPKGTVSTQKKQTGAVGLLAMCWLLTSGTFVAVKWAGPFTPPWTMVFFHLLLATLYLLPFATSYFKVMATQLRAHLMAIILIANATAVTQGCMFVGLG